MGNPGNPGGRPENLKRTRGPGRPKGSKTRTPLALQDVFARVLELSGGHQKKVGHLKGLGYDGPEVTDREAYLLSMAISDDASERRVFQQGLLKLMPAMAVVKGELGLSESLEQLLEESRVVEARIIEQETAGELPEETDES